MFQGEIIYFRQYLISERRFSPHTVRSYLSDTSQFLEYLLNEYSLKNGFLAKKQHAREWLSSLKQRELSHTSINRKVVAVRSFYDYLRREERVKINPFSSLISLKKEKKLPEYINATEIDKIVFFLSETKKVSPQEKLIFETLLTSGIRVSELISIKVQDIELSEMRIRITNPKGNKERFALISKALKENIQKYIVENNTPNEKYLFLTKKKQKIYHLFVYRITQKILALFSTQTKSNPHVLRHSLATSLLKNGADIMSVKEILGHESVNSTQIYTHLDINTLKKTVSSYHPKP